MGIRGLGVVMMVLVAQAAYADCSSDLVDSINAICTNVSNVNNDEVCKMGKIVNAFQDASLYGQTNVDYVRTISICDPNTNNGQPCLDATHAASTHDVVTLTVATDDSFIAIHGQEALDGLKNRYQCVKGALVTIVGVSNVIEAAPVAIVVEPQPHDNPPPAPNAVPAAVACQSDDFTCDDKVTYPLPIGKYCKTSTVDLGKQESLLWIEGEQGAFILNSRTQKAILCKAATNCNKAGGFYGAGRDVDGSHLMLLFEGEGGKVKLLNKNVAGMFRKLLSTKGKGITEVLNAPEVENCEAIQALLSNDLAKAEDVTEQDAPLVAEVEKISAEIPFSKGQEAVAVKLEELSKVAVGSDSFGKKLLEEMIKPETTAKLAQEGYPGIVIHKIEGFGDRPNAIVADALGGHVFRLGIDDSVFLDSDDLLPGAREYILADLDNFGGKDLIGLTDTAVIMLPKKNLPPQIDNLDLKSDTTSQKVHGQAGVKTQEGEQLSFQWRVFEFKDGKLTERPDLITNATTAAPTLNFPADSVATHEAALPTETTIDVAPADVGVNAGLSKSIGARKEVSAGSQSVYFVALTATDPGNLSATRYAAISKNVSGAKEAAAGPVVPATPTTFPQNATLGTAIGSFFGFEGGCSLIRR